MFKCKCGEIIDAGEMRCIVCGKEFKGRKPKSKWPFPVEILEKGNIVNL